MDASKPTGRKLSTKRTREQQRKSIDASYKLLFSQPTMVIDLLKGYVKQELPPVLPMVLYNGKSPWKFTTQLYDLIDVIPGGIEQFIPRFDFLLLEEHKYKDHPLPAHEQNLKQ
ncbi:Rpn family recombination-promoting nuclease/putative transposase [Aliidiomarina celeris]|uniref:Rpn family recombination-promoting nuclease/putative transposase n=1 Tax=Aliidiomarina celeris TaxID=2249428 RepID=UPI000DE96A67|nr:Rpn family recombination-promoting nuclease/putative transposase [Aliidiomarina celeris]